MSDRSKETGTIGGCFAFRLRVARVAAALAFLPAAFPRALQAQDPSELEPRPRQGHVIVADNRERLHVIGGNDGARIIWDHWVYDSRDGCWEKRDLPRELVALNAMEAAFADGSIVVVGSVPQTISAGRVKSQPSPPLACPSPDLLNTVYVFDVDAEAWTTYHPVPAPSDRSAYSLASLSDGSVLLFGGERLTQEGWIDDGDSWILQPRRGAWTKLETAVSPPARRLALASPIEGGKVLLAGGSSGEDKRLEDCWLFDPREAAWSRIEGTSVPPFVIASGAALPDGRFIMQRQVLGEDYPGDLWLFEPSRKAWREVGGADGFETRLSPLAAIGGSLWLFSGSRGEDLYFGVESFVVESR
jgi:hypothetical protein